MVLYPSILYTLQPFVCTAFQEQQLVITCTTTNSLLTIPFVKLRPTTHVVRVHAFRWNWNMFLKKNASAVFNLYNRFFSPLQSLVSVYNNIILYTLLYTGKTDDGDKRALNFVFYYIRFFFIARSRRNDDDDERTIYIYIYNMMRAVVHVDEQKLKTTVYAVVCGIQTDVITDS